MTGRLQACNAFHYTKIRFAPIGSPNLSEYAALVSRYGWLALTSMRGETLQPSALIRVLRCARTHRFFSETGWTEDLLSAAFFADQISAITACLDHGLYDVELVLLNGGAEIFSAVIR